MTGMVTAAIISLIIFGSDTSLNTDIGWHTLESHDSYSTSLLRYSSLQKSISNAGAEKGISAHLLSIHDIHYDTSLQHACKSSLDSEGILLRGAIGAIADVG
jgi:hypothetical protein